MGTIVGICGCEILQSAGAPESAEAAPSSAAGRMLRIALLVLLKERDDHGYALYGRMQSMGFATPSPTRMYRLLRTLDKEGLVIASWELSERGPARRIYALTAQGDRYLRESMPAMSAERDALRDVLGLYRKLVKHQRA